ncbi:MAG: sigma-70 family RNA polymerase sigma factor [Planctomycetaceae bacterium]|nr:sigma-70 family RNA polymerase sigma factor [Planctomycetaceae bacterium]
MPVIESSESTSRTLLERVRRHEPEAWRRFATLYGPIVYRWIGLSRLSHEDALDLTQEVFLSASQHLHSFQREATGQSLRNWLWTVTRHKVLNHLRAKRGADAIGGSAMHEQLQQLPEREESDPSLVAAVSCELSQRAVRLMQNDFEPSTWQAFWETTVGERPAAEVGRELGLSTAAVYKAKSRVLQRLRQELAGLTE